MTLPAIYHDAYSFAVREWRALDLGTHPSDAQLAQLGALVAKRLASLYPRALAADRRSAASYGVNQAYRDLAERSLGGPLATLGQAAGAIAATIETAAGAAEQAVETAAGAAERAAGGTLAAILRAVSLPRAALPTRVPTNSAHAFTQLSRQLGRTLPTQLATTGRTRTALRNLSRRR